MADSNEVSMTEKIRQVFLARPNEDLPIDTVYASIDGADRTAVMFSLSALAKRGFAVRVGKGVYRLAAEGETVKAQSKRERAAQRADKAQEVADNPAAAAAARPSVKPLGLKGKVPDLTVVGRLRDGKVLLEDTSGNLWSAVRLVEEARR